MKIEPERRREYDSHTLDLLFSGPISRPDFAADFLKTVCTFKHMWLPWGGLLASLSALFWRSVFEWNFD